MNIIGRCRQLVHAKFDTTLGGELHWGFPANPKSQLTFVNWIQRKSLLHGLAVKECTYSTCFINFNSNGQGNKEFITWGLKTVVRAWFTWGLDCGSFPCVHCKTIVSSTHCISLHRWFIVTASYLAGYSLSCWTLKSNWGLWSKVAENLGWSGRDNWKHRRETGIP